MKRIIVLLLMATCLVVAPADARPAPIAPVAGTASAIKVLSKTMSRTRIVTYRVSTPSLTMSAKTPLTVDVVLPTGYNQHPKTRYPVLYALPGTSNKANVWLNNVDLLGMTANLPVIIVVADGTYNGDGGGFYTNWVDQKTSRGIANWETFHTQELVPWIDHHYRTIPTRAKRAIVGISQGGFGSFSYAARHPRLYGAAAAFSGAVDIYNGPTCQVGASVLISAIMTGLNQVEPFAPFGDPLTNASNWKAHDPGTIVGNLRHTRLDLFTSDGVPAQRELSNPAVVGTAGMEFLMHQSNLCFRTAADAAGVAYHWHEYVVGTHDWIYMARSLKDYLPLLMNYFRTGH